MKSKCGNCHCSQEKKPEIIEVTHEDLLRLGEYKAPKHTTLDKVEPKP